MQEITDHFISPLEFLKLAGCLFFRFDKAMFQTYLGKDAIFVETVRHPLKRFQSAINFFG